MKDMIINSSELSRRGITTIYFDTIDSTSSAARRYATDGGNTPALFVANSQSAGRGRLGRSFYSPADTGIYETLLIDVTSDSSASLSLVTSAVAVAVSDAIWETLQIECQIKWVNDVYVNGRKACGILAESFFVGDRRFLAIGIGVNLGTEDFPAELDGIATSLCTSFTQALRARLASRIAASVFDIYGDVKSGNRSFMDKYRSRSAVLGNQISFTKNGVTKSGVASEINNEGHLTVILDDQSLEILSSGEISVRLQQTINGGKTDE